MEINKIYNESCLDTITTMITDDIHPHVILTSPPYNTSYKNSHDKYMHRYGEYVDIETNENYVNKTVNLFNQFDKILAKNGVVIYNLSYSARQTSLYITTIAKIIEKTNFELVDKITWKKGHIFPDNRSPNRLTRIVEDIFILVRKDEINTFHANKDVLNIAKTGAVNYQPIHNYIEAKNNDGSNPYNKATYSSDLCCKLLNIYAPNNSLVYDPFMGTGTTALACLKLHHNYIGSEIDKKQCDYSEERLKEYLKQKEQNINFN